jgi:hypothetical protein
MSTASNSKNTLATTAASLAKRLSEDLLQERIIPRFVDSYVVEHGRYGLQVHAALYRDLLGLLQREALLALSARAMEIVTKGLSSDDAKKNIPLKRAEIVPFRQKYIVALTRHQRWNVADALEFQSDLQVYEELLNRVTSTRRRKPFEAANHPFVDRCAFVLDSSFMEKARLAASRALIDLESLAMHIVETLRAESAPQKSSRPL